MRVQTCGSLLLMLCFRLRLFVIHQHILSGFETVQMFICKERTDHLYVSILSFWALFLFFSKLLQPPFFWTFINKVVILLLICLKRKKAIQEYFLQILITLSNCCLCGNMFFLSCSQGWIVHAGAQGHFFPFSEDRVPVVLKFFFG